ncbi:MAG: VWA domain-containing protein [Armatimonadetes bacterium]|nr:VWA domain-containing protein [Armatimonadota bacterium]
MKKYAAVLAVLFFSAGLIAFTLGAVPRANRVDYVRILVDVSGSVGSDLVNKYVPAAIDLVDRAGKAKLRIVKFGSRTRTIYDEHGQYFHRQAAKQALLNVRLLPADHLGSDISRIVADEVTDAFLNGRTLLVVFSDGWEDFSSGLSSQIAKPFSGRGEVVLAYNRNTHPRVGDVLRTAGVLVRSASNFQELQQVTSPLLTGLWPWQQQARQASLGCFLASGLCVLLLSGSTLRRRVSREGSAVIGDESEILHVKSANDAVLARRPAQLKIQLVGHQLSFSQRVSLGWDVVKIAADVDPEADFQIPAQLFGNAAYKVKADILAADLGQAKVTNSGDTPIMVGPDAVQPGNSAILSSGQSLYLTSQVKLLVLVELPPQVAKGSGSSEATDAIPVVVDQPTAERSF